VSISIVEGYSLNSCIPILMYFQFIVIIECNIKEEQSNSSIVHFYNFKTIPYKKEKFNKNIIGLEEKFCSFILLTQNYIYNIFVKNDQNLKKGF